MNLSKRTLNITFDVDDQFDDFDKSYLSIEPKHEFSILPRERKEIEITFHPKMRLHMFKKELLYKIVEN